MSWALSSFALTLLCVAFETDANAGRLTPTFIVSGGQTVVASAVVTNAPYNADSTGRTDATRAIQNAVDDVARVNGGVVFLPAGKYRIESGLTLGYGVTLMGEWTHPASGGIGKGTILLAYGGRNDSSGEPLIKATEAETGVMDLSVYYPEQKPEDIRPYPVTISTYLATLKNLTLYNSFDTINMRALGGSLLFNIYGTALNTGILAPEAGEFSWMHDIHFSNGYWKKAAKALGGVPMTPTQAAKLDTYTHSHLTGLEIQRIDGLVIYHYGADDARTPILMKKNPLYPDRVFGFGGVAADLRGKRQELGWAPWYFYMHYANLDNVPEATGKRYAFAGTPTPSRTDPASFINVTCSPYNAVGDGKSDDTSALQRALADVGRQGGGTVYLPQGGYKITAPLVVPTGVELRGPYGAGKIREYAQTCTLDVYCGKDSKSPETDTAFITLMPKSGIRGFTIAHPEQAYDVTQLHNYPYSVRGDGPGIWIIGVNLLNSCYGIDLATHQCDKHIVKDVWATVFYKGINVGGNSRGGKLEHMAFSQGPWLESYMLASIATKEGNEAAASFRRHNSVDYLFGDCRGETSWGLAGFAPYVHCRFYKDKGQGCTNADFWQTAHDVGIRSDIQAESGADINLIGYFGTGYEHQVHNWLEVGEDFKGPLNVYAKTIQQTCVAHPFRFTADQVRFFDEVSLTTGRKAAASQTDSGSSPANAVDRNDRTFWQAPSGSYLDVDLGQIKTVTGFGMQGPGLYCDESLNPAEAELRVSVDGKSYAAAGSVNARPGGEAQPHPYAWADTPVDPVRARYVRLYVNKPGADGKIRVSNFYVYGY